MEIRTPGTPGNPQSTSVAVVKASPFVKPPTDAYTFALAQEAERAHRRAMQAKAREAREAVRLAQAFLAKIEHANLVESVRAAITGIPDQSAEVLADRVRQTLALHSNSNGVCTHCTDASTFDMYDGIEDAEWPCDTVRLLTGQSQS